MFADLDAEAIRDEAERFAAGLFDGPTAMFHLSRTPTGRVEDELAVLAWNGAAQRAVGDAMASASASP